MKLQTKQSRQLRQLRQTSQMTLINPKNKQIKLTSTLTRHFVYCRDGAYSVLAPTPCAISSSGRRDESASGCHPERSEGSPCPSRQILRCAQDDKRVLSIPAVFWST